MTPGEIWDVLVRLCQASVLEKARFESYVLENAMDHNVREYSFGGALGSGGKVWLNTGEFPYVTCYPEDLTDEREAMIRSANEVLRKLSGVKETDGNTLEVLGSKLLPAGQVTKCRLGVDVFYIRESLVPGGFDDGKRQVLELLCPDACRAKIENIVKMEDSMKRTVVRNPEFTEAWAEAALSS